MRTELDFGKSIDENAANFFEESKKAKKKLHGLHAAIEETERKIAALKEKSLVASASKNIKKRKHAWFENYHWFFSSNGFLVVAGRNAKQNEELVKKHLDEGDLFLHANIQGGAATIIKAEGKTISDETKKEAADFAGVFSKAWQKGISSVDVYLVSKEQVSKKAQSGEFLSTGGFMIYGKREWFKAALNLSIGIKKEKENFIVISGPPAAIKKNSLASIEIKHGNLKPSDAAKKIMKRFSDSLKETPSVHLDEIIKMLPSSDINI